MTFTRLRHLSLFLFLFSAMNLNVYKDVLAWIQGDAHDAVMCLEHSHNESLTSDSSGFHFWDDAKGKMFRPRGLTTPLAEVFWASKGLPSVRRVSASGRSQGTRRAKTAQEAARGMLRGNIVHQQIEDLVTLDSERFHRRHRNGAHPWSLDALTAINNRGARPLVCELGVIARDINIATRIDQVAVKENGGLVFIEVKTGYDSNEAWRGATRWMRGVLKGHLLDSALNRAIVQVVAGAMLAVTSREIEGPIECWVVHISSDGTEIIQVGARFVNRYGPIIFNALREHQSRKKKGGV